MPSRHPTNAVLLANLLAALLAVSACSYDKSDGVALPERFDEPNGPLAFADESLAEEQWVVVNTDSGLNLRADPTTDSESLALVAAGEAVSSTSHVMDVDGVRWIEVRWEQTIGWVHSGYLAPASNSSATSAEAPVVQTVAGDVLVVISDAGGTTLRTQPDGAVLADLPALSEVTATGTVSGEWIEVVSDEVAGWVSSRSVVPLTAGGQDEIGQSETIAGPTGPAIVYVEGTDGLNMRSAPNGTISGQVPDTSVVVLTGTATSDWSEISYHNRTGWVSTHFLVRVLGDLNDRGAAMTAGVAVTNTPGSVGINIRDFPNGDVIARMVAGEYATVAGPPDGDWVEISFEGLTGWALVELLVPVIGFEDRLGG